MTTSGDTPEPPGISGDTPEPPGPGAPDRHPLSMTVNGRPVDLVVESRRTLAEVLREDLGLTGTHLACEHGVCGACTVALDGEAARSCLMLALQAEGCAVETVESLCLEGGGLGPLQQAMADSHSFQCAFCAPGFLMTVHCLLAEQPDLTREQIREELSGNLCRCTGYQSIVDGVVAAAALAAGSSAIGSAAIGSSAIGSSAIGSSAIGSSAIGSSESGPPG